MKYFDYFSDPALAQGLLRKIHQVTTKKWSIMEICGGQTHAIMKYGLTELLPEKIELIHGPGCPVCVTPMEKIDQAIALASRPGIILCTFGDMIRVPGTESSLGQVKAKGAQVRVVYSPLDAVDVAVENPDTQVVFFAVGFETTAPVTALAAYKAQKLGLLNFSMLVSHVLVPPALKALLGDQECRIDGILAAGHVCTIMGLDEYYPIAEGHRVPIVVTGFEPVDILSGIYHCILQLERGSNEVDNQYGRSVQDSGNSRAIALVKQVYEVADLEWRGLGIIPRSGLELSEEFHFLDATKRFELGPSLVSSQSLKCQSGRILTGAIKPNDCPHFRVECTPDYPLGAPMVSAEGACSAYYLYHGKSL
jgi:hydrogenase expression/formation protein HypD